MLHKQNMKEDQINVESKFHEQVEQILSANLNFPVEKNTSRSSKMVLKV